MQPPAENQEGISSIPAIAPWWHTALFIGLILGTSVLSGTTAAHRQYDQHHLLRYLTALVWEWILAALVLWGLRMRRLPLRQLLGIRRPSLADWRYDLMLAAAFWLASVFVLAIIAIVLQLAHLSSPQKAIAQLAPGNALELLLWILLSLSAGICEELAFRGYLLQQFASASGKLWIGAVLSSLIFGLAHGYEGLQGMTSITAYGLLFCVLVIRRKSLRAGMMAHAWHDAFTGAVLLLLKHSHVL